MENLTGNYSYMYVYGLKHDMETFHYFNVKYNNCRMSK